jgi:membrane-bound lytic murein transglycosylase D
MDKQTKPVFIIITAIILLFSVNFAKAQIDQADADAAKLKQIKDQAETHFIVGLTALKDNRGSQARASFDKSVDVFLTWGAIVRDNQKLRQCYAELMETIYRLEFSAGRQSPEIRNLLQSCDWKIDESIVKAAQKSSSVETQGFTEQKFEPSPLDDLAKLELTEREKQIETDPIAARQYRLVEVANVKQSLGFSFQMRPLIQQYINYYRGRGRSTMETGLYRSGMFMRMVRRIFREEGIPANVAWLGQVESMWKPTARSWAAAAGLWQFIPGTGARFGLRQNVYLDERNSFETATRAAARYLRFLANRYNGNWELALAAYNCGEGNVDRAVRRAGVADFWTAYPYLPQETRNYVPNILATILIANNPNAYGFGSIKPAPQLMYDSVRIPAMTNLYLIAQVTNTTVEYIRYLNPELRLNISPPEPYVIRFPLSKSAEITARLGTLPKNRVSKTVLAQKFKK